MPKKLNETIWIRRNGFRHDGKHRYEVVRSQNTVDPRIGSFIDEADVRSLVDEGLTVNIS